jgi:vitamin B12 transporter
MRLLLPLLLLTFPLHATENTEFDAPERIVVTASRMKQYLADLSPSITIISDADLKAKRYLNLRNYLDEIQGLTVVATGGPGGSTSVFVRGAASDQTLVLIDGIKANDMTSPGSGFDFGTLTVNEVERIEIIRGPHSVAYGSAAIGGVINIITQKGRGPFKGTFQAETGSFATNAAKLGFSGSQGALHYSLGLLGLTSDGYSAADVENQDGEEKDGIQKHSIAARLGYERDKNYALEAIFRQSQADFDIDAAAGADDPNQTLDSQQQLYQFNAHKMLFAGKWQPSLSWSLFDVDRQVSNKPDPISDQQSESEFLGERQVLSLQNEIQVPNGRLNLGIEQEIEKAESTYTSPAFSSAFNHQSRTTNSAFLQTEWFIGELVTINAGIRQDDFDSLGKEITYKVGGVLSLNEDRTLIRVASGTGFKAPSLYQLYSQYGTANLNPETSQSWEASVEQRYGKSFMVGLTYFEQDFEQLIEFDGATSTYRNRAEASSRGVESIISGRFTDRLTSKLTHTWLEATDDQTDKPLPSRPREQYALSLHYDAEPLWFSVMAHHRTKLYGNEFTADSEPSQNLDATIHYNVNPTLKVWVRGQNLTDEDDPALPGYKRPGRAFFGGLEATLL